MNAEVYLLSIPLTRHRSIVARPRRADGAAPICGVREPQARHHDVTEQRSESPLATGATPHIDPG